METSIELQDRVILYNQKFLDYPSLTYSNSWIVGTWAIGHAFAREKGYHGEFPPSFLNRVLAMFPDKKKRLYAFSGTLQRWDGITVDVKAELKPSVVADVQDLPFRRNEFSLTIADPPYTPEDAKKYGTKPISRPKAVKELARVTEPGGFLVWLDLMVPRYRKADWTLVGLIGLYTGTNRRFRAVSIFERPGEVKRQPLW